MLAQELGWLTDIVPAKRPQRLPTVLTQQEVRSLLSAVQGVPWLIANLLYGAGLRLTEGLRLRVKDIDFTANHLVVREGKGDKDRITMLPSVVKEPLDRSPCAGACLTPTRPDTRIWQSCPP